MINRHLTVKTTMGIVTSPLSNYFKGDRICCYVLTIFILEVVASELISRVGYGTYHNAIYFFTFINFIGNRNSQGGKFWCSERNYWVRFSRLVSLIICRVYFSWLRIKKTPGVPFIVSALLILCHQFCNLIPSTNKFYKFYKVPLGPSIRLSFYWLESWIGVQIYTIAA